ncbi:MAG: hypothetical protein QNL04_06070 [SAR324 cluster bacterium]|nr:hypothetical protein [SAR324 cluster bacterium]
MKQVLKKAILVSGLLMAITPSVFAEEMGDDYSFKMKGKLRTFYGQLNSGVDGETAHMTEFNEANIAGSVKRGAMTGYFEIESREGSESPTTIRNITYKTAPGIVIGIGTFKPKWGYNFSWGGGTETSEAANFNFYKGLLNKLEGDALQFEYKAGDHKMGITMYQDDRIHKSSGSTTQIGAMGKIGPIHYRVNSNSAVSDDFAGGETASSSASNVGLKYKGEGFAVSVDSASKDKGYAESTSTDDDGVSSTTDAYSKLYSESALQGRVNIGSDELIVTLATEEYKKDTTGADVTTTAHTDIVYVVPVAKKANIKFVYGSAAETTATDDTTDTEETVTGTFAGLGFFIKF